MFSNPKDFTTLLFSAGLVQLVWRLAQYRELCQCVCKRKHEKHTDWRYTAIDITQALALGSTLGVMILASQPMNRFQAKVAIGLECVFFVSAMFAEVLKKSSPLGNRDTNGQMRR